MSEATAALLGDNGGAGAGAPSGAPAGGAATPPWHGQTDVDAAAYITNKGWQSPTDMLTSYRNLEKFAGGSKSLVELPPDDAPPEKVAEFYDRLGRPKTPQDYGIAPPEGGDKALAEWFTKTAHDHGLSAKQAKGLFDQWQTMTGSRMQEMEAAQREVSEQGIASLKKEWGQQYEAQITAGRRAASALGYDEAKLTALESKMGTAEMLSLFATLGSKMGEPAFASNGRSGDAGGFGTSPAMAQQQLADLKLDKEFMARYQGGDKDALAKFTRLMNLAHPG